MKLRIDLSKKGRKVYRDTSVVLNSVSDWAIKGDWLNAVVDLDNGAASIHIKMKHIDFFAQVPSCISEPRELEFGIWNNACCRQKHSRRKSR